LLYLKRSLSAIASDQHSRSTFTVVPCSTALTIVALEKRVSNVFTDCHCLHNPTLPRLCHQHCIAQRCNDASPGQRADLVLFDEALQLIIRASRLLTSTTTNSTSSSSGVLCIGEPGSGRRATLRLAAYVTGAVVVEPSTATTQSSYNASSSSSSKKWYGAAGLLEDLRPLCRTAGIVSTTAS
jgi:P-loop containing dynein motor region D4